MGMEMKPECVECPYIGRSGKDECVCELPPCVKQLQAELDKRKKWHDYFAWEREYDKLQAKLEAHSWIPVSEILPEKSDLYLVCDFSDKQQPHFIVSFFAGTGSGLFNYTSATHWKPITLPEGDK